MSKHEKNGNRDADQAFHNAIQSGRLTRYSARNYMYMGLGLDGEDAFKHIDTRQYLPSDTTTAISATAFSTIWRRGA